jgi:thiaminase
VLDSLWSAATRHPFLEAVREGTTTDSAFDRWLVQDALFVGDLLTFQARLLARAPRAAQAVLAGGCVALVAELDWFEVRPRGGGSTWSGQRNRRRSPTANCWSDWMPRRMRRR